MSRTIDEMKERAGELGDDKDPAVGRLHMTAEIAARQEETNALLEVQNGLLRRIARATETIVAGLPAGGSE